MPRRYWTIGLVCLVIFGLGSVLAIHLWRKGQQDSAVATLIMVWLAIVVFLVIVS